MTTPVMKNLFGAALSCSFCGRAEDEVSVLVAGPQVFICDECVELCRLIVQERRGELGEMVEADLYGAAPP